MHPLEHLIYLSGFLVHWIIPSHPIHLVYHLLHAGLSPANGHSGFHRIEVNDKPNVKSTSALPLDKWFGSFHNGSPEAHAAIRGCHRRIKQGKQKYWEVDPSVSTGLQ